MHRIAAIALLALVLLVGAEPRAFAAITLVNTASGGDGSGNPDATIATGAFSLSANNLVIVAVSAGQSGGQTWPPTLSDTAGNTFTFIDTGSYDGNNNVSCFYAKNTASNAADVVTATFSGTWTFAEIISAQYSGLSTSSPLDATATGTSSGSSTTSVTSTSFSTTSANEVLVAVARELFNSGQTFTAGTGYTLEAQDSGHNIALEDQIVAATQSGVTASMTYSASVGWEECVATFSVAGTQHQLLLQGVGQ